MRIAVASDDGTTIASHFGKTRGFVIFDIEDGRVAKRTYIKNTFTGHARGLSGADHSVDRRCLRCGAKLLREGSRHHELLKKKQAS